MTDPARPDNWSVEDYARWWICQPECGEMSKRHIEALLGRVDALTESLRRMMDATGFLPTPDRAEKIMEAWQEARSVLAAVGAEPAKETP